jgi:hypothetical protein
LALTQKNKEDSDGKYKRKIHSQKRRTLFLILKKGSANSIGYITYRDRMIVNEELGSMYKDHDYSKTQLQHLPGRSKIRTGHSVQDIN